MNNMATSQLKTNAEPSTNGELTLTLCTFCNNSTNGFEKRLFATAQPKGPFFPVLAELQGKKTKLDDLGRAVVCVACFHHLLRQWSSFERRGIPVRKREYNIITDDRVNNYQARREEEIRKEAEHKIKEIQDREERIRQEAEERFEKYRQRQEEIRREAEERLLEEQTKAEELKKRTSSKLKQEQQREEELRRQAEERIREEKGKREYIRQEAERLLREEKLLEAHRANLDSTSPTLEVVTTYRTEVIIPSPEKGIVPFKEIAHQTDSQDMEGVVTDKELQARSQRRKMMEYDPETGCYRKIAKDDDKENTVLEPKTERVEYRFRLRSDEKPRKPTEVKDSSSKPDKASEDITVSMEPTQYSTEQTIVLNGKERTRSKDGDEEDLKKAGDIMKAKFEEGRKKFEPEPVARKRSDSSKQRTTRATSDDSLEEKIKEMEKRRERLLLRGPSGKMETQGRRPSEERKDLSPRTESPRDGSKSPVDDPTKKQRSRSERNKRRLTAEEFSLKKSSGSEEDLPGRTSDADAAKVPKKEEKQTETKKESFKIQLKKVEKPDKPEDEVFATQVKPVEASVNLMSWDDSTDGPASVPEKDSPPRAGFRKRADSAEGEMFPAMKLVEIEAPITVVKKEEVKSEPVFAGSILDLDETSGMSSSPAIEPISTWDNRARASNSAEEDRRRREREHEERKRRIEENQRRAAKELKAKKQSESDVKPRRDEPVVHEGEREMSMKEKRRSLVDMWESFSEPQTNIMSFEDDDEEMPANQSNTVVVREKRTVMFDPLEDKDNEEAMEVVDDSTRPSVEEEKNTNLTDEEQRWESAGQFQPGRLQKTVFHSLSKESPADEQPKPMPRKVGSRYDWMKGETSDDQAALIPSKLKLDWQNSPSQTTDEKLSNGHVRASSPEPIQVEIKPDSHDIKSSSESESESENESENESESKSEEDRTPRVDTDDYHKLTEEEKQWESAGHFQPKKLNISLMTGFQQAPVDEVKPAPKKTQGGPYMQNRIQQTTSEQEILVPAKLNVQESEPEIEEISPVSEVTTETEPHTSSLYTYEYDEESDEDDEIPGWRKVEEERRRQEREEIERAKMEEKRRMEREAMEEDSQDESDSSDDEFEANVRTREVRKINPNLLIQFMKAPEKEPDKPIKLVKPKEQKIAMSDVQLSESSPVVDIPFEDGHEKGREVEDEYEEKVKSGQIRKLKLDNSPFLQAKEPDTIHILHKDVPRASRIAVQEERYVQNVQSCTVQSAPRKEWEEERDEPEIDTYGASTLESYEDESDDDDDVPEWRKMEEKRRQQEQEEIQRAKLEEKRRQEREAMESEEQDDTDSVDDEFEAKVKTKEIRRINPNLLVQFMSENKEEVPSIRRPKKETIETQQVSVTETAPNIDLEDVQVKDSDDEDDEFELKVKKGQVNKLVLDNSPFLQKHTKEETPVARRRSDVEKCRKEPKQDSRTPVVQEDVLVQVVHDEVVESQPDVGFLEEGEDDEYEMKIKSRGVKKLDHNQFVFLRKQEEEERKRLQEEERRRVEREEREVLKKEDERRRRLEAEARVREEERVRREEETRRKEEEKRAHREEEKRRKLEEAKRLRQEEEERLRKEEEDELMRLEEMRRQKQAAKLKFESGSFDDGAVNRSEKDIYSVGRLDSNKFMQFQQRPSEEPKLKSRPRVEKRTSDEFKLAEPEVETVEIASVDLIESSPYEEDWGQTEDAEYEERRKSVGKLDKEWYIKQQRKQTEENERRAKELEEQKLREERNEMLRIKDGGSKRLEDDDSSAEMLERSNSEKRRSKLTADKFSLFEYDDPGTDFKRTRKPKEVSITVEKKDDVQTAPLEYYESDDKEMKTSMSYEDEGVVILGMDDAETAQRKMRLQREREETELLRQEEERRRRLLDEEESLDFPSNEVESDKPKNVGKLNYQQFSIFQQEGSTKTRKQAPAVVQEVISVQSQEDVESAPVTMAEAEEYRGPTVTQEDEEYEKRINTGKRLDVDRFLSSRSQEADERTQRAKRVAEERMRQEQEELAKLKFEERKRMQGELDTDYVEGSGGGQTTESNRKKSASASEVDYEKSRKISIERKTSQPMEYETERTDKGFGVGRLPQELRSQFEGGERKKSSSDSRRKSSKSKGSRSLTSGESTTTNSIESPRSTSGDSLSSEPHNKDVNGSVTLNEKESLERKSQSLDRREYSKETLEEDREIESYIPEEKPVPKKLNTNMLAAFQKGESEPVQLRRAKSEKRARPKSIGNVDLLKWQDDSNLPRQSSSGTSQKGKTGRQPRPKSIAY